MGKRIFGLGIIFLLPTLLIFSLRSTTLWMSEAGGSVVISEVAWAGTASGFTSDEWLELYNPTSMPINISGWTLRDSDASLDILLNGTVPALSFFLLERTDDTTVADMPADQIYTGSLLNSGDTLTLRDAGNQIIDSANSNGGAWPAGTGSPNYQTMERTDPLLPDSDSNWNNNDTITINGTNANGGIINGTPRQPNSSWNSSPAPNLIAGKTAPATAPPDSNISYNLTLTNNGNQTANTVLLTDSLPAGFSYVADNSSFPHTQPTPGTIVWQVGDLANNSSLSFVLTAYVPANSSGIVTNTVIGNAGNASPTIAHATTNITIQGNSSVLVNAVFYDGFLTNDLDEAVQLINLGTDPADISNWRLWDGVQDTNLPASLILPAGQTIWFANSATAFSQSFGFLPDYETAGTNPTVPDLPDSWLGLANSGDELILQDNAGTIVDVLVYKNGNTGQNGWQGNAVSPYNPTSISSRAEQIIYRKRDQTTGLPVPDSNRAEDWAQEPTDPINGRKILYPGWDLDPFFFPLHITQTAYLTVAIAPDNGYETLVAQLDTAQSSLQMTFHTFENIGVMNSLLSALNRGVAVTILLEGSPPGGMDDQQKYVCQQLEAAGGACWFMRSDDTTGVYNRYQFLHAKFILIDGVRVLISSENLSPNSLPDDDKSDGTFGRRGVLLITDAPDVVAHVQAIFDHDFDLPASATPPSTGHHDLVRWHAGTDAPSPGFVPITLTGGTTYTVRYAEPLVLHEQLPFELVQSPETSLRTVDSLLGLINRAGNNDTILVQQLNEPSHWGGSAGTPETDPNLRLSALLSAARRGAKVRVLLDEFITFGSNNETCDYLNNIARTEHINLACATANPTGLGIHNKMFLAEIAGKGYIHIGSINGSEQSNKGNRELALQVQSDQAYALLADMFERDYPHNVYIPISFNSFQGPADHLLISELLYDPPGIDDAEFCRDCEPYLPDDRFIEFCHWRCCFTHRF